MRRMAIWTTTAVMALFSVAHAQEAAAPEASASAAPKSALGEAVTAYAAFQSDLSGLRTANIARNTDLETAIDTATRHNKDALTRGWVAYGAMTAEQSPAFVQGVRDAANYYGRDAVVRAILADPYYARGLRGGPEAMQLVLSSASADSARILNVADRYEEMAYRLQRQAWANTVAPQQPARVQRVRASNSHGSVDVTLPADMTARLDPGIVTVTPGRDANAFGGRNFWGAVNGETQVVEVASQVSNSWRVNESRGEALNRMMAIAALSTLGAAEQNTQVVDTMLNDPRTHDCIEMAQLQLYQCMSSAHFRYENVFCVGHHAMRDVGQCVGELAQPDAANMTPLPGAAH